MLTLLAFVDSNPLSPGCRKLERLFWPLFMIADRRAGLRLDILPGARTDQAVRDFMLGSKPNRDAGESRPCKDDASDDGIRRLRPSASRKYRSFIVGSANASYPILYCRSRSAPGREESANSGHSLRSGNRSNCVHRGPWI